MLEDWSKKISWDDWKSSLDWGKRGKYLIVIAVCLGILALTWPQGTSNPQEKQTTSILPSEGVSQAKVTLTRELQNILSQIDGAGQVEVSLTLSSDGVKSYARNTQDERRETQELDSTGGDRNIKEENQSSDIAVSGGEALLIEDSAPVVVGVLVVAEGAHVATVREQLTDAATTLLNISPHQVRVVARKGVNQ